MSSKIKFQLNCFVVLGLAGVLTPFFPPHLGLATDLWESVVSLYILGLLLSFVGLLASSLLVENTQSL